MKGAFLVGRTKGLIIDPSDICYEEECEESREEKNPDRKNKTGKARKENCSCKRNQARTQKDKLEARWRAAAGSQTLHRICDRQCAVLHRVFLCRAVCDELHARLCYSGNQHLHTEISAAVD